jgi:hypothetical protein
VALTLLWSLTALAVLSATPHQIECGDEDGMAAVHDAAGHAIGAVRTTDDPLHCVLCHWIRAFSADGIRAARLAVITATPLAPAAIPVEVPRTVARLNLAPRAPPFL